jgi:Protein of unknown function (DUF3768).
MTTNRIAQLNDALRTTLTGGRIVLSQEMQRLPAAEQAAILSRVRTYSAFTPGNNPYGKHDFGDLLLADGRTVFWQIDAYAPDLRHGSDDPTDPDRTVRVLTVMFGHER